MLLFLEITINFKHIYEPQEIEIGYSEKAKNNSKILIL